jgi:hypothetical protein
MPAYSIRAKIDQIVTKEVQLLIEAEDVDAAKVMAREALQEYPAPVPYNPMIHRIVTTKSSYWIPKSIEFIESREETDADD